jgi:hypothetical protein
VPRVPTRASHHSLARIPGQGVQQGFTCPSLHCGSVLRAALPDRCAHLGALSLLLCKKGWGAAAVGAACHARNAMHGRRAFVEHRLRVPCMRASNGRGRAAADENMHRAMGLGPADSSRLYSLRQPGRALCPARPTHDRHAAPAFTLAWVVWPLCACSGDGGAGKGGDSRPSAAGADAAGAPGGYAPGAARLSSQRPQGAPPSTTFLVPLAMPTPAMTRAPPWQPGTRMLFEHSASGRGWALHSPVASGLARNCPPPSQQVPRRRSPLTRMGVDGASSC